MQRLYEEMTFGGEVPADVNAYLTYKESIEEGDPEVAEDIELITLVKAVEIVVDKYWPGQALYVPGRPTPEQMNDMRTVSADFLMRFTLLRKYRQVRGTRVQLPGSLAMYRPAVAMMDKVVKHLENQIDRKAWSPVQTKTKSDREILADDNFWKDVESEDDDAELEEEIERDDGKSPINPLEDLGGTRE